MFKLDDTLGKVKELHSHSILNNDEYYTDKLLQVIIDLSTIDNQSLVNTKSEINKDEIEKVKRKVPKWMTKTHKYNYQILKAYMDLSDYNVSTVKVEELEEYVDMGKVFLGHYNSLKTISEKNHAKVFEEINKQVELWKPVAEFIEDIFEEKIEMNKNKASKMINKFYEDNRLNPNNNGNVKFANKNSSKNVYWINIHMDNRIKDEFHLLLNNDIERKLIHLVIPPNTFNSDLFVCRYDEKSRLDMLDIELSVDKLVDIKSGSSNFTFKDYIEREYNY